MPLIPIFAIEDLVLFEKVAYLILRTRQLFELTYVISWLPNGFKKTTKTPIGGYNHLAQVYEEVFLI